MMKRTSCLLAMLFCLFLGVIGGMGSKTNYGLFIVENSSDEDVDQIEINVMDLKIKLPGIKTNDLITGRYEIPGDSHYDIVVTFVSGRTVEFSSGYMTDGLDSSDLFIIENDSIEHHSIPPVEIN